MGRMPRSCTAPHRACGGAPDSGLPAPSNGTFYSDLGFQNLMGLEPRPAGRGRHHHQLPGRQGRRSTTRSPRSTPSAPTFPRCRRRWPKVSTRRRSFPGSGASIPTRWAAMRAPKSGQYTTMLEVASEPALDGRLQFAGEHTSSDFLGFMNGGVAKRKPCLRRAHRGHGTAKEMSVQRAGGGADRS